MMLLHDRRGVHLALAARRELPEELYSLARVEGAGACYSSDVTLPLMAPALLLLARETPRWACSRRSPSLC